MKTIFAVAALAALATPAIADDRVLLTQIEQQLSDAITNGTPEVWVNYLDPDVVFAEEDCSYARARTRWSRKSVRCRKVSAERSRSDLLSYHEDGDTAVALFLAERGRILLRADHPRELSDQHGLEKARRRMAAD